VPRSGGGNERETRYRPDQASKSRDPRSEKTALAVASRLSVDFHVFCTPLTVDNVTLPDSFLQSQCIHPCRISQN
jgi:hypothetical protein